MSLNQPAHQPMNQPPTRLPGSGWSIHPPIPSHLSNLCHLPTIHSSNCPFQLAFYKPQICYVPPLSNHSLSVFQSPAHPPFHSSPQQLSHHLLTHLILLSLLPSLYPSIHLCSAPPGEVAQGQRKGCLLGLRGGWVQGRNATHTGLPVTVCQGSDPPLPLSTFCPAAGGISPNL